MSIAEDYLISSVSNVVYSCEDNSAYYHLPFFRCFALEHCGYHGLASPCLGNGLPPVLELSPYLASVATIKEEVCFVLVFLVVENTSCVSLVVVV